MSLNDILNQIEAEYKAELEQIKAEADTKVAEIKEQNLKNLAKKEVELLKLKENEKAKMLEKSSSKWALDWKEKILQAKHKVINKLFNEVKTQVLQSNKKDYQTLLTKLLMKVSEDSAEIISAKWQTQMLNEAIQMANKKFKISWEGNFKWGCKIITTSAEYDFTLESLIAKFRKDKELEISKKLF